MTTATTTTSTAVDRLLDVVTGARSPFAGDIYAADATFDAVVPGWRFAVTGEQIPHQLAEWFGHPGTLEELDRHPTPTGEVVTYTVAWVEGGVPHAARHVHVLTVEHDRIVRDQVWCGGRWPAALLAEMEVAQR